MARLNRDTRAIRNSVEGSTLQSSLFKWLVKRHDEFTERWADRKIDWRTVCAEFAALGLTDTLGKPATESNARKTWQRVRKHVAAVRARAAAKPPRPFYPSRLPKDWRPENAPPDEPAPVPALPPPALDWTPPAGSLDVLNPIRKPPGEKKPYDPEEAWTRLDRTIKSRRW